MLVKCTGSIHCNGGKYASGDCLHYHWHESKLICIKSHCKTMDCLVECVDENDNPREYDYDCNGERYS
jgi:hypothetical protein